MSALTTFFCLFAISYVNGWLLHQRLQRSHHGLWVELGEPSLMQSNLRAPYWKTMKFVWSLRFLEVRDGKLSMFCFSAMLLELGILVAVILIFAGR